MNQFKILAHGKDFNVDLFLSDTSLVPTSSWRKGETTQDFCLSPKTSGFDVVLGDGESLDIQSQQQIGIEYIQSNLRGRKACAEFPGMDHFMIFIQMRKEIDLSVVGFCIGLNRQLLYLTNRVKMDAIMHVDLLRLDRKECGLSPWPPEPDA